MEKIYLTYEECLDTFILPDFSDIDKQKSADVKKKIAKDYFYPLLKYIISKELSEKIDSEEIIYIWFFILTGIWAHNLYSIKKEKIDAFYTFNPFSNYIDHDIETMVKNGPFCYNFLLQLNIMKYTSDENYEREYIFKSNNSIDWYIENNDSYKIENCKKDFYDDNIANLEKKIRIAFYSDTDPIVQNNNSMGGAKITNKF